MVAYNYVKKVSIEFLRWNGKTAVSGTKWGIKPIQDACFRRMLKEFNTSCAVCDKSLHDHGNVYNRSKDIGVDMLLGQRACPGEIVVRSVTGDGSYIFEFFDDMRHFRSFYVKRKRRKKQ